MILLNTATDPSTTYMLLGAIATMGTAIGYLYKKSESQRDKTEQYLQENNRDMQGLLEKTLAQFSEVERKIIENSSQQTEALKSIFGSSQDQILNEIRSIITKNTKSE